jgi:hypothetical protein
MIPPPPASSTPADLNEADAVTLALRGRQHSHVNRRHGAPSRLLTAALIASTLTATVFCVLYIRKPVHVVAAENPSPAAALVKEPTDVPISPIETSAEAEAAPASGTRDGYEETNLRVQHVLNASTAEGDLSRIVLEVPVLYSSRSLRWTEAEVLRARGILSRVADYHEQSRSLRELGAGILSDWNDLIERSIPADELRADSPSLPANQEDAARMPRPAVLDTTDSIEVRPTGP